MRKKEGRKQLKCKLCSDVVFVSKSEYLAHNRDLHKNFYICSDCGKQLKTKGELKQHINSQCGTVKKYKCQVCELSLMSQGSLYNHMLRHTGERSFMCRFCAKQFLTAGQLKVHERIHTLEKAYICDVCGKGFCHRQSLITHNTLHTGIKPFQCENCGNSFSCVGNLFKHRRTHSDTCGLVPLTTHRVKHPATRIKVKINTPTNSRLKDREVLQKPTTLNSLKQEMIPFQSNDTKEDVTVNAQSNDKLGAEKTKTNDSDAVETKPKIISSANGVKKEDSNNDWDSCSNNKYDSSSNDCDSTDLATRLSDLSKKKVNNAGNISDNSIFIENKIQDATSINEIEDKESCIKENQEFPKKNIAKKENKLLICKDCGKFYKSIKYFSKHKCKHKEVVAAENSVKEDRIKCSLKCEFCCELFKTKDGRLKHKQEEHLHALTCSECNKVFVYRQSLRSHQQICHKGIPRKTYTYICEKCGKQFAAKSVMKVHKNNNCGNGPQYKCPVCLKLFSTCYTRMSHMKVHDPEKKLLCKFCGKSFHWKGQLKIHERCHTGEKPYVCLHCNKAFAYKISLITHSSLHTGIRAHLCGTCGMRFSCIGNLRKHSKTHTIKCETKIQS